MMMKTIDDNATATATATTMTTTTSCSEKDSINTALLLNGTKESLLALNAQRAALESEAAAIVSELEAPGAAGQRPMGINTPLVDAEGYPRNDIDLYRCKTLRGRLAIIQTDLCALYKDTERHLLQLGTLQEKSPERIEADKNEYAARLQPKPKPKFDPVTGKWVVKNWDGSIAGAGKEGGQGRSFDTLEATSATVQAAAIRQLLPSNSNNSTPSTGTAPATTSAAATTAETPTAAMMMSRSPRTPFSRVNQVAPNSPAFEAGLLENDLIVQFGDISLNDNTASTTASTAAAAADDAMTRVAVLVPLAAAQGRAIQITVLRGAGNGTNSAGTDDGTTTVVSLSLTPQPWSGRGMIGCHIVPYQQQAPPTVFAFPTSS